MLLQPYQFEQTANLQPVDLIKFVSKHVDNTVLRNELLSTYKWVCLKPEVSWKPGPLLFPPLQADLVL